MSFKYSWIILFGWIVGFLSLQTVAGGSEGQENTGKRIFLKNKCNFCHTVTSQSIGNPPAEQDDADDDWGDDEDEVTPPDLSGVGLKHKGPWLHLYLRKQTVNTSGDKHKKRFKGSEEERTELVNWLLTLTTPVEKVEKGKQKK